MTATDLLSAAILPGLLCPLRETAPGIRVRIVASSDVQNLTQREADIAIRHVRPEQPDLIARHVSRALCNGDSCVAAPSRLHQDVGSARLPDAAGRWPWRIGGAVSGAGCRSRDEYSLTKSPIDFSLTGETYIRDYETLDLLNGLSRCCLF